MRFWTNQLVVCTEFGTTLTPMDTFQIQYIVDTPFGRGFTLIGQPPTRIFLERLFIPRLDWISFEQELYELIYKQ